MFENKDEEIGFIEGCSFIFGLFFLVSMFFVFPTKQTKVETYAGTERTYFYQDGTMWSVKNNTTDAWWIKDHQ